MNYFKKQLLSIALKSGVISLDNNNSFYPVSEWIGNKYSFDNHIDDEKIIDESYAINNAAYSVVKMSTDASTSIPFTLCHGDARW